MANNEYFLADWSWLGLSGIVWRKTFHGLIYDLVLTSPTRVNLRQRLQGPDVSDKPRQIA